MHSLDLVCTPEEDGTRHGHAFEGFLHDERIFDNLFPVEGDVQLEGRELT